MYTQEEYIEVQKQAKRRLWIAVIPAAALLLAAIGVFIYGQAVRSDRLWMVTTGLTIIGGGWFLFLYGTYVRPMRQYMRHVGYMLCQRQHCATGVYKSFADALSEKNGVACHALMLNVGDRDDGEDDRLFYYDAYKTRPGLPLGSRVTITSNDMMVSDFQPAE